MAGSAFSTFTYEAVQFTPGILNRTHMKSCYKFFLMMVGLAGLPGPGFSQSNEIKITFIANCGLYLTDGNSTIYVDFPYKSGAYMYAKYDRSEIDSLKDNAIFIFTHKHRDHYSRRLVKKCKGKVYGPWNAKKLEQLDSSIQDISIQPFVTEHRFSSNHCSYLITWHGKKIFISGDTEHAETIAALTDLDWAFIPVWLLMDARKKGLKIDAKMIGLYHIGPKERITTADPKIHLMVKQGEVISIPY
jgi:L-ascorbate metabolism protein UlaG (beta-lactamase superfamily)